MTSYRASLRQFIDSLPKDEKLQESEQNSRFRRIVAGVVDCVGSPFRPSVAMSLEGVAAHFDKKKEPLTVVMPPGPDRTRALLNCAQALDAERVLILTRSRAGRKSILAAARGLEEAGQLPAGVVAPEVLEVAHRVRTTASWKGLGEHDLAVGTLSSLTPGSYGVPQPPKSLFDVVIFDEDRPASGRIWSRLAVAFTGTSKLLMFADAPPARPAGLGDEVDAWSYFTDHYQRVSLPTGEPGLREAQSGAIHAVASHFTLHANPALVVMPTGSGKTAVLMISAFLQRSRRVLVVTPSRLVRRQIADEFRSFDTLKRTLGVLPEELETPRVHSVEHKITTTAAWRALAAYDVVVATPNSISPGMKGVPDPPERLFDVVMVDEAHHSPARTWNRLIGAFPEARKVMFTATPFRLDRQEIPGTVVYDYPIKRAYEKRIFGEIRYVPVEPGEGEDVDVLLAQKAEEMLNADHDAELNHRLMVRTDRIAHGKELFELYKKNTGLKLQLVRGGHSNVYVQRMVKKLRMDPWKEKDGLHGVICVDMLGEGFDCPELKIAAIHRTHKTLGVTLQFIGRFARKRPDLGTARFLAVPNEVRIEAERLYEEGAVWQELLPGLYEEKVVQDQGIRRDLKSFERPAPSDFDLRDFNLWTLKPLSHVKVYQVFCPISVGKTIALPKPFEIVDRQVSRKLSAAVIIAREAQTPRWTGLEIFDRVEYDLFVVYYNEKHRLLFINASRRSVKLYEALASEYSGPDHRILPLFKMNRVLRGLRGVHCYNVGLRNRQKSVYTESYRILAGWATEKALARSDGRLFHRGHVFIGAEAKHRSRTDGGERKVLYKRVTLGYSSASKVWSNQAMQIPELIAWCRKLAAKIGNPRRVRVGNNLDYLSVGQQLKAVPQGVMLADWDEDVYRRSLKMTPGEDSDAENGHSVDLLDCTWRITAEHPDRRGLEVVLVAPESRQWILHYSLDTPQFFSAAPGEQLPELKSRGEKMALLDYLNQYPLNFYTADFSRFRGEELFRAPKKGLKPIARSQIETIDWRGEDVEIRREFERLPSGGLNPHSIHGFLADYLRSPDVEVVFYDHRAGEMADFLVLAPDNGRTDASFYHVKGSAGDEPGDRVGDAYEVCGQVVKSLMWMSRPRDLVQRIDKRRASGSPFLKGDMEKVRRLLGDRTRPVDFHIALVQPGLKAGKIRNTADVLAAADDYVRRAISNPLRVLASA